MTEDQAPEIARFLARSSTSTTSRCSSGCARRAAASSTSRATPLDAGHRRPPGGRGPRLRGLSTRRDAVRSYPAHDIAANLVGFMGTDKPYGGLEEIFNKALSGKDGSEKYEVGAGNRIPLGDNTTVPAVDGQDLHTTIDRDLQWYTQRVLRQAVENANGSSGIAVVMDSRTGEVLAFADDPTFDADDPGASPVTDRRARSLNLSYEPGSVEKVLTLSALIDTGKVNARTKMLGARRPAPPGPRHPRPLGPRADQADAGRRAGQVVERRNRAGLRQVRAGRAALVPRQVRPRPAHQRRARRRVAGQPARPSVWNSQTGDRIAFGQSLSVNAVQMAAAVDTLANGGVRVDPSTDPGPGQGATTAWRSAPTSPRPAAWSPRRRLGR